MSILKQLYAGLCAAVVVTVLVGPLAAQTDRAPADLKIVKDIVYKKADGQSLDLWLFPPAAKKFDRAPLVIYIHGGGWGSGDKQRVFKSHVLDTVTQLTKSGVACASIEYRLVNGGKSNAYDAAADCKDAVRFLALNADKYELDPNRIGLFGTSAGGNLALVAALGDDTDYPCEVAPADLMGKVRCVAVYYPCTSFVNPELFKGTNFERPQRFVSLLGGSLDAKKDIARKLSPIELVKSDSPPIFLAHGAADTTLPFTHSTMMEAAAKEKGVPVECIISKGAGHGFKGESIAPTEAEISKRTAAFYLKYLMQ
jgi:acetyl esterase/lipase